MNYSEASLCRTYCHLKQIMTHSYVSKSDLMCPSELKTFSLSKLFDLCSRIVQLKRGHTAVAVEGGS